MNNPHQSARLTVYSREQIVARAPARVAGRLPDRLVALALHLRRDLRLTGRRSRPGSSSLTRPALIRRWIGCVNDR
ncbi:hypothetical protein [Stappia sp.]|uniref:hypothetical protein n=1 Tax=Stappia sp. TaxID=1870903 RepID=UPI003C7E8513